MVQEVGLRAGCEPIPWSRILDFVPMRADADSPQQLRILSVFAWDLTGLEHPDDTGTDSRDLLIGQGPASTQGLRRIRLVDRTARKSAVFFDELDTDLRARGVMGFDSLDDLIHYGPPAFWCLSVTVNHYRAALDDSQFPSMFSVTPLDLAICPHLVLAQVADFPCKALQTPE